jgi:hypothetical protein
MKCARCHDSPYHSTKQEDLFSLAALLEGKPVTLPTTSTVPPEFFKREGKSDSIVKVTLQPGTAVAPKWPFPEFVKKAGTEGEIDPAWEIVRPENERFARVIVNRVWKRYFGEGFVEPVNDWEGNQASHPELLEFLGREFVASGYDLRHLSRLMLNSEAFRREARFARTSTPDERFFEAPLRQKFSAEQLVDTLLNNWLIFCVSYSEPLILCRNNFKTCLFISDQLFSSKRDEKFCFWIFSIGQGKIFENTG